MSRYFNYSSLKVLTILVLMSACVLGQECGLSANSARSTGFVKGVDTKSVDVIPAGVKGDWGLLLLAIRFADCQSEVHVAASVYFLLHDQYQDN